MIGPIMIVDDSETLRRTMRQLTTEIGRESCEAENAEQAFRLLREDPRIKLIFVDYNMPEMNGIELVRRLKGEFVERPLFCVIFTSIGQHEELMAVAKEAGVLSWLTKPVEAVQIEVIIDSLEKANASPSDGSGKG